MRAPTPTFRNELTAFLAGRKPPAVPGGIGNRNSADTALMKRWLDDDRADEIWTQIKLKAPNLTPTEFIQAVLKARRSAAASVSRIFGASLPRGEKLPGFNAEWLEFLPILKKRIIRQLGFPSALPPTKAAEILEDAAREIRTLHQSYFGFSDQVEFGLSRESSNRSRTAFYRIIRDFLQKHCGENLDYVVAVLSEIAFPGKEIDAENVRDALRSKKTKPPPL
jgi:hypothetical protein